MDCDCIDKATEALKEHDTELDVTFLMPTMREVLRVPTKWCDGVKPKRGKRPKVVLITFCPFCGKQA